MTNPSWHNRDRPWPGDLGYAVDGQLKFAFNWDYAGIFGVSFNPFLGCEQGINGYLVVLYR